MPAFFVPSGNVTPDPIFVSDDEFKALDTPLGDKLRGSAVVVQWVKLRYYRYEDM